jgi:PRTRC genetic system protein B
MRFDAHFGEAEAVQLKAAILLYGGAKKIAFASVHEPHRDPEAGAPYLDAGRPITTEFLRALARGLGLGMAPEILPQSVLMRTPEITAWWVPAAVRPMFFSQASDGKTLNGLSYPHPPLVFVLDGEHGLSLRALAENRRPGATSAVAVAPYWNVNERGEICLGSMATPRSAGLASLDEWVESFFQSEFTHAGSLRITSHNEGHLGLWRDLAGRKTFPPEWLIPAGTLEDWLCRRG